MANDGVLIDPLDFLTLAKRAGFAYEKLASLLAYSKTASGLDVTYSKRITYSGEPPLRILFVGPLALPVNPALETTRKSVTNPDTAFIDAYRLSMGGMSYYYLPPIEEHDLSENIINAQGHYAVWLTKQGQTDIEVNNGDS